MEEGGNIFEISKTDLRRGKRIIFLNPKQNENIIKQNAEIFIEGYVFNLAHFSWGNVTRWTFGSFKVERGRW